VSERAVYLRSEGLSRAEALHARFVEHYQVLYLDPVLVHDRAERDASAPGRSVESAPGN
jgi:hypothetical protein